MTQELKACPFCDHEAKFERIGTPRQSTICQCTHCGATLDTGEEWDHGRGWNTRAREDALEAESVRLRDALEIAAVYLDDLGDNLLRNDADMMLDDCRDPKAVAADLRTALGDTQ